MRIVPFICFLLLIASCAGGAKKKNTVKIDWQIAGNIPGPTKDSSAAGVAGPLAGVYQDVLIIGGGANFPDSMPWQGGKKKYQNALYAFKKNGGKMEPVGSSSLPFTTAYGASCSTTDGIVYAGGENEQGISKMAILLRWIDGEALVEDLPDLPMPITNASMATDQAYVYLLGGEDGQKTLSTVFKLNIKKKDRWEKMPDLPAALSHSVAAIQSNGDHKNLYIVGGRRKNACAISDISSAVYEYDLKLGRWKQRSDMPHASAAATGLASGSSYILVFGGDQGETFSRVETMLLEIGRESDDLKKQELIRQKNELLTNHPGFCSDVLLFNTITNKWTKIDSIPYQSQVTTTALWWGEDIIIPSGEIRAGVRTPTIVKGSFLKNQMFSIADIAVLIICFLLMTVARYFMTSSKTTTSDYFKGGQRIPQWAAGISIFGAKLSAITFMGIPAKTYGTDWTYFFLLMTIIMIMPVVLNFFIPFYRKLNVTSAYEYLEKRFSYISRLAASLLYVLLQLGRMGIVILLPSIALMLVTGINVMLCILLIGAISIFFTVKGGIEAVIWVEVIQVLILAGGALLCLFYIPFQLDDLQGSWQSLQVADKLKVFDFRFDLTEPTLWVVLIGGLAIQLVTYGTDQTTVQRYLTTKDLSESKKSLKIGAWLTLPSTIVFFSIGTLLYLFFQQHPAEVNYTLQNQDNIFPWYIVSQLPAGLSGLLIAGIFAAAMSSTEASMNSVATLLTTDIYKKIKHDVTEKQTLFFARICTLLIGLFATSIALYMANSGVSSLWDKFNTILGLFTGTIGGMFVLGIFTQRANSVGVTMGMICSFITQLLVQYYTPLHFLLYAFTGLASCVLFGYLFSLLISTKEKNIQGLTVHS
jgi:SSS family transporter